MYDPVKVHELEPMRRSAVTTGLPRDQQVRLIETLSQLLEEREHPFADDG